MKAQMVDDDPEGRSPVVEPTKPRLVDVLGPGLITGASDDDPSGIAVYLSSGDGSIDDQCPPGTNDGPRDRGRAAAALPDLAVAGHRLLLLVANTINLGADLGAIGDAVNLLLPGLRWF